MLEQTTFDYSFQIQSLIVWFSLELLLCCYQILLLGSEVPEHHPVGFEPSACLGAGLILLLAHVVLARRV
jgi:hypothetical protein